LDGRGLAAIWKDDGAAVGTEYAVLLFVVAMGMAVAALSLADGITIAITRAADTLQNAGVTPPPRCCD
jgi:Flp pilus assembly pilin Flp